MTLQQIKYVVAIAEKGSFSKAAEALFISQPSLSNAIHNLEAELNTSLFVRLSNGVRITPEGYEFVVAAKQIMQQTENISRHYSRSQEITTSRLYISSVHISYAIRAFLKFLHIQNKLRYDFCFFDQESPQVILDLAQQNSEVGIIDFSTSNKNTIMNMLKKHQLEYTPITLEHPYALMRVNHPLAYKQSVTLDELDVYPFIYFISDYNASVNKMLLSNHNPQKCLWGRDHSTLVSLLRSTDGYSICHGLMDDEFYNGLTIVKLECINEQIEVGWIKRRGVVLSSLAQMYVRMLEDEASLMIQQRSMRQSSILLK